MWDNGRSTDLGHRRRWGTTVAAINDDGQIVGRTGDTGEIARTALWTEQKS
jgi:uncharacterized membrane protein